MGMAEDVLDDLKGRIHKTLDDLRRELAKVRTGRANPTLLEGVRVDYYGQMSPLQNVANVTVADPRLIVVKHPIGGLNADELRERIEAATKGLSEATHT